MGSQLPGGVVGNLPSRPHGEVKCHLSKRGWEKETESGGRNQQDLVYYIMHITLKIETNTK